MNKLFIVANWKMNGSKSSNEQLMEYINKHVYESANLEIVICPPYIYLDQIIKLKVPAIKIGAQNISEREKEVLKIYNSLRQANLHKMKEIPVCIISESLK